MKRCKECGWIMVKVRWFYPLSVCSNWNCKKNAANFLVNVDKNLHKQKGKT